jgi:hypothetical protein
MPPRRACAVALVLTIAAAACSNAAVDKAAGQGAGAGIAVVPAPDGLTIENHTTRPLLNVRVSVTASGAASPFVRVVPAIEPNQTQEVRFADLLSEAGTLLDPAINAPQQATVAARDTLGNTYSADANW